jgi:hypothetical protein
MKTVIAKNAFGWFAETVVQVTSTMRVVVTTMKRSDGQITTIAREERAGPAGMYFYAPYTMWSVRVKLSQGRATKQAIELQQAEALFEIDDVIKQAKLPEAA